MIPSRSAEKLAIIEDAKLHITMSTLRIALDWTANTNHAPIYVALANGYYAEVGLDVEIITPDTDNYTISPATRLVRGEVHVALCPSESIISYRLAPQRIPLIAVAAMLDKDASSIATLTSSGITRPKELDGKCYASYNARFEDATVRALVRADGGKGDLRIVNEPRLDTWDYISRGNADATWIFTAWEGLLAQQSGKQINSFSLTAHEIPYGYSPVFAVRQDTVNADLVRKFLAATAKGAAFTAQQTEKAAGIVEKEVPPSARGIVSESLGLLVSGGYYRGEAWGMMAPQRWEAWVRWLVNERMLEEGISSEDLFTNEFLE